MNNPWTDKVPLPGGDIDSVLMSTQIWAEQYPSLPADFLRKLVMRHGSRADSILNGVATLNDLGKTFGQGANLLCEREIEFFVREEWARTAEDILWRRSKCGLHMDSTEREQASNFIADTVNRLIAKI